MKEKLLKLKLDLIASKQKKGYYGRSGDIQRYLIDRARKFARENIDTDMGVNRECTKRAWLYYEYLKQYDPYAASAKETLESMIKNTQGGNNDTPSVFLNYISMSIASETDKHWETLVV